MSTQLSPQPTARSAVADRTLRLTPNTVMSPQLVLRSQDLPLVIGRDHSANVHLNDPWVSRRHCEIDLAGDEFVVRDLDSKHGTYVNDMMIIEKYLTPGDAVSIGLTTFQVSVE